VVVGGECKDGGSVDRRWGCGGGGGGRLEVEGGGGGGLGGGGGGCEGERGGVG